MMETHTLSSPDVPQQLTITCTEPALRVDRWIAERIPTLSRARVQTLIRQGCVLLNGKRCKPSVRLQAGDRLEITIPPITPPGTEPEPIPLNIIFEDADLLVINKPPGLVVHPAPGHPRGTLVNALLHHCRDLAGIGGELRPGIVHRLDRDTSGVLVVAKNQLALERLAAQFKARKVEKEYWALVWGRPALKTGTIETLIGRDSHNRKKMSARPSRGRVARTRYEVMREFGEISLLRIHIETGRTHQIRVHLAHIGYPVVGDSQYGRARKTKRHLVAPRQMLHAYRISFSHPRTSRHVEFVAPLPADMQDMLRRLQGHETTARLTT